MRIEPIKTAKPNTFDAWEEINPNLPPQPSVTNRTFSKTWQGLSLWNTFLKRWTLPWSQRTIKITMKINGIKPACFFVLNNKKIRNAFTGVLTGKGTNWGGSLIRPEATGYGLVYFFAEMLKTREDWLNGKTVTF